LADVAEHDDNDVLVKIDDNILLTAGDPQGILDQQFRPSPIHILNIISIDCIGLFFISLFKKLKNIPIAFNILLLQHF
jgi:hypothetical protein